MGSRPEKGKCYQLRNLSITSTFSIQDGEKSSIQLDASCFLKLAARLDRACEGFDFPSSVGSGSASASSVSTSRGSDDWGGSTCG